MNLFKLLFNRAARANPDAGIDLAELLRQSTSHDQVHIVATDSQAREATLVLTRRWGQQHRRGAFGIVSTCSAGPTAVSAPPNDLAALHAAIDARTVAIILEPRLGEAADRLETHDYFQGVAQLCRELKILLILDETRTGLGRQQTLLCELRCGIRADILVLGGVIESGRTVAAVLARGSDVSGKRPATSTAGNWPAVAA
ncbi:MAG: acetylornithine aminotransferase [Pseudomonas sp.]|uniref:aminotransferase class III-fold pyridoxal phosphate-dependent enzyme n=1 Tax=Pseudomonas sp. TaxID=306 RepID=UPI00261A389E|nr:aminotransferase class III-fold pyridoxal phosphate-dependent enzyme [Pseudomonas sp.]MDB6048690.1 acetylornithine aminotransferase [Pseudomonas sp.]